jgi:hypothetical protein
VYDCLHSEVLEVRCEGITNAGTRCKLTSTMYSRYRNWKAQPLTEGKRYCALHATRHAAPARRKRDADSEDELGAAASGTDEGIDPLKSVPLPSLEASTFHRSALLGAM